MEGSPFPELLSAPSTLTFSPKILWRQCRVEVATKSLRGAFILQAKSGRTINLLEDCLAAPFYFRYFCDNFFLKKKRWKESNKKQT